MRLLHQDRKTGEIKFQVDNMDDLWHLYNIIDVGDLVLASTYRREEQKADKVRNERGAKKKRVFLGIRVEKMEFHEFDTRLRITAVIEQGPQDLGTHHTLNVEEGEVLTVVKLHWRDSTLERIKRALDDSKRPTIVFVSIENDEATIAVMRQYGMQNLATIYGPAGGKMYEQKTDDDFYLEVIEKVSQLHETPDDRLGGAGRSAGVAERALPAVEGVPFRRGGQARSRRQRQDAAEEQEGCGRGPRREAGRGGTLDEHDLLVQQDACQRSSGGMSLPPPVRERRR